MGGVIRYGDVLSENSFQEGGHLPPGHMSTSEEPDNEALGQTWVNVVWGPPDPLPDNHSPPMILTVLAGPSVRVRQWEIRRAP